MHATVDTSAQPTSSSIPTHQMYMQLASGIVLPCHGVRVLAWACWFTGPHSVVVLELFYLQCIHPLHSCTRRYSRTQMKTAKG
jgi:hypothetical protein